MRSTDGDYAHAVVDGAATGHRNTTYAAERLELVEQLEAFHFWFAGRRALVERLLDTHLDGRADSAIDVGCGTGSFLPVLAARADRVVGIDPLAKETEATRRATAERLPFPDATFGLAVCLDVLEHVDDEAALTELARVVRPGGLLIVTVPAFSWLWSARDDAAAHRRRYGRAQLTQLLEAAGFDVAEIAYYQFFLFPLVVASRWAARRRPDVLEHEHFPAPFLNRALTFVNTLEVRFGSRVKWPFGSTLAVAARRRS